MLLSLSTERRGVLRGVGFALAVQAFWKNEADSPAFTSSISTRAIALSAPI